MEMSRNRVCVFDHVWASGRREGAGVGVRGEGVGSYLQIGGLAIAGWQVSLKAVPHRGTEHH